MIKKCPKCGTIWDTRRKTCSWKKCDRAVLVELLTYKSQLHKEAEEGRRIIAQYGKALRDAGISV